MLSALDPGKQGLKRGNRCDGINFLVLSALDPGKQGLKLRVHPVEILEGVGFQRLIQENKD